MPYYARQDTEIEPLIEVVGAVVNPGLIANGTAVTVTVSPVGSQVAVGDVVNPIPPASVGALAGVIVIAAPAAAAGQITITFRNESGAGVTPVSATWKFLNVRYPATFF